MKVAIRAAQAGNIPPATEALTVLFERALDPDSVVREAEAARPGQFSGLIARIQAMWERALKGGATVPLSELPGYVALAEEMTAAAAWRLEDERARIERIALEIGEDPRNIVPASLPLQVAIPPPQLQQQPGATTTSAPPAAPPATTAPPAPTSGWQMIDGVLYKDGKPF